MAEPLTIRFASDVEGAKRGMASLAASVASNAITIGSTLKAVNDNASRVSSTLTAMPTAFRGLAIGVAAFMALKLAIDVTSQAVEAARERLESLTKIASQAQGAGVGTTFLQGWLGQAQALKTEVSTLEGMLTRAREAATVRIGEGDRGATSPMLDRLRQNVAAGNLGQGDLDRYTGAKDQEARIRVILELIEQLQAKGAQLAAFDLANKMFGAEFEAKLRSGVDMIGGMRTALDGMTSSGGTRIITPEEIAAGERINALLREAERVMADALGPIQRDMATWSLQQAEAWANLKLSMAEAVGYAASIYGHISAIGDAITRFGNSPFWNKIYDAAKALGLANNAVKDLTDEDRQAAKGGTPLPAITVPGDRSRSLPSIGSRSGGGSTASEVDQVDSFIKSLERSTAALKAETAAYGLSNVARQNAVALARAEELAKQRGSALTEDEIARIRSVATAAGQAKDRMAELQQQSQQAAEAMRTFGQMGVDALTDMILEGKSFEDVVNNLAKQLIKLALQGALMGSGPFAGLLGTGPTPGATGASSTGGLFGLIGGLFRGFAGGFAEGGEVPPGKWALVGERGPELIGASATARTVIPNGALRAPTVQAPATHGIAAPSGGRDVVINNYTGQPVETREGNRKGPQGPSLEVTIGKMIDAHLSNPSTNKTVRQAFGVRGMRALGG